MLHLFKAGEVVGKSSTPTPTPTATTTLTPTPTATTTATLQQQKPQKNIEIKAFKLPSNPLEEDTIIIDKSIKSTYKNLQTSGKVTQVTQVAQTARQTRVLFCGTYPIGQSNGYSRVVYYISKFLGLKEDIDLTIYGFQNYNQTAGSDQRNDIPSSVKLHDALATEEPKRNGFGEKEIATFLKKNPQDIVIIFNDMVITSALVQTIVNEMSEEERKSFLMVSYMDQVYPYQKPQYISMLNIYFDAIITFTPYWKKIALELGIDKKKPMYVLPHGFDHTLYYPIPKKVARIFYQIPEDSFAILNLNRNQPRKRYDHTIMAFADVISRYYNLIQKNESAKMKKYIRPIRLVIATMIDGSWNLMEILEHELKSRNVPYEFGKECVVALSKPQQLSDRDINILYNACDVGLNTCEGEGFGLTVSEHGGIGKPQIAQKIGGMQEFMNENNSIIIEPKWRYYIDKQRDGIGGIAEVGDIKDYADALWKYYNDEKLAEKHGKKFRENMLQHFQWSTIVDHFHNIILDIKNNVKKTPTVTK